MKENSKEGNERPTVFPDERTKHVFELLYQVRDLAKTLSDGVDDRRLRPIQLLNEDEQRVSDAEYVVLFAGTLTVASPHPDVWLVPERTIRILENLDLPYTTWRG